MTATYLMDRFFPAAIGAALLLSFATLVAAEEKDLWAKGMEGLYGGNYGDAARSFQLLAERGDAGSETYYNLGLARKGAGEVPEAVLAYLRALAIDPAFHPARRALQHLVSENGIEVPEPGIAERVAAAVGSRTLWVAGSSVAWAGAFCVLCGLVLARRRAWLLGGGIALLLLGKVVLAFGYLGDPLVAERNLAVVITSGAVPMRVNPVDGAAEVRSLPAGSIVGILSKRGNWTYAIAEGNEGWLASDQIVPVSPPRS